MNSQNYSKIFERLKKELQSKDLRDALDQLESACIEFGVGHGRKVGFVNGLALAAKYIRAIHDQPNIADEVERLRPDREWNRRELLRLRDGK